MSDKKKSIMLESRKTAQFVKPDGDDTFHMENDSQISIETVEQQKRSSTDKEAVKPKNELTTSGNPSDAAEKSDPKSFKDLAWWKIFNDRKIAAVSMVYHFYFELYKVALVLTLLMFVFGGIQKLGLHIAETNYQDENGKPEEVPQFTIVMIIYVINIIILRLIRHFQTKYIIKNNKIYKLDWGEDKFSLVIERLPADTNDEELMIFFNNLLEENGIKDGSVRQVLLLKQCHDLHIIMKKAEKLEVKIEDEADLVKKEMLKKKLEDLNEKMKKIKAEENSNTRSTGKAIVIFNKVESRNFIKNKFSRYTYQKFKGFKIHKFKNSQINAKYISEPKDIKYYNMHFSFWSRMWRRFFSESMGWILLAVSFYGTLIISWREECKEGLREGSFCDDVDQESEWEEYMGGVLVAVSGFVIEKTQEFLAKFKVHYSFTHEHKEYIDHMNMMSFFNYVFLFIPFLIAQGKKGTIQQVRITFYIYLGQQLINKVLSLGLLKRFKRRYYRKRPEKFNALKPSQKRKIEEPDTFDFIGGLEHSVPLIFMAIGFNLVEPLLVLGVAFGTLLVLALVDRLIIIYFTQPVEIKSSRFGLAFMRVLNWDVTVYICTIVFWLLWYWQDRAPKFFKSTGQDTVLSLFGLFMAMWLITIPGLYRDLFAKVQKRFDKMNKDETYDSVSSQFTTTYEKEYTFNQIKI